MADRSPLKQPVSTKIDGLGFHGVEGSQWGGAATAGDLGRANAKSGGGAEHWNFRLLLSQGVLAGLAHQLTSVTLVLPFLYTALGGPLVVAGLLVPIVRGSGLIAQFAAVPIVETARLHKWYIAGAFITTAAALAVVCLTAGDVGAATLAAVFLFVVAVIGVSGSLNALATQDMMGRMLPAEHQNTLLYAQSGIAGFFAIGIAYAGQHLINSGSAVGEHIELVWAGIIMMVLAALVISAVREPSRAETEASGRKLSPVKRFREHFTTASKQPWLRRFLVARLLFLSIELAIPFFAMHAAVLYAGKSSGLNIFVIASSIGLVAGGIIWPRISKKSVRIVMVLSAFTNSLAGLVAVAIDYLPAFQNTFSYAAVFVLAGIGFEGIINARTLYIVTRTSDEERPAFIAVASIVTGAVGIALAAILGTLAHLQNVVWPLWILIGLNIGAAIYAIRLADVSPKEVVGKGAAHHVSMLHAARSHTA